MNPERPSHKTSLAWKLVSGAVWVQAVVTSSLGPYRAWHFAARELRPRRFDLAILPRWDAGYYYGAFVAFWSGARCRAGYSERVTPYKAVVNRGFDRLLTDVLDDPSVRHDIEHNLESLRFLGIEPAGDGQEVWADDEDRAFADETLRAAGAGPEEAVIGIGPSGGHSVLKQWPVDRFPQAGGQLQETHRARILVFGGPGEEALGDAPAGALGPTALLLALHRYDAALSRQKAVRAFGWVGLFSYSLYLIHVLVIGIVNQIVREVKSPERLHLFWFSATVFLAVAAGRVFHQFCERSFVKPVAPAPPPAGGAGDRRRPHGGVTGAGIPLFLKPPGRDLFAYCLRRHGHPG